MLEICRENGGEDGDILNAVERIANGYLSAETSCKTCDKAIVVNNVLVKFCAIWRRIDARKNIFAYIIHDAALFFEALNGGCLIIT